MEPPPAPTVLISTEGKRTGKPATSRLKLSPVWYASISATSALVPPMSKVMTSPVPAWRATWTAPTAPAAGPDSAVRMGISAARSTDIKPPDD